MSSMAGNVKQEPIMILSVSNIHKSFNEIPVLANVSFHIEDYDKTAIVGINGAGKTTLLRIIMGEICKNAAWCI